MAKKKHLKTRQQMWRYGILMMIRVEKSERQDNTPRELKIAAEAFPSCVNRVVPAVYINTAAPGRQADQRLASQVLYGLGRTRQRQSIKHKTRSEQPPALLTPRATKNLGDPPRFFCAR